MARSSHNDLQQKEAETEAKVVATQKQLDQMDAEIALRGKAREDVRNTLIRYRNRLIKIKFQLELQAAKDQQ